MDVKVRFWTWKGCDTGRLAYNCRMFVFKDKGDWEIRWVETSEIGTDSWSRMKSALFRANAAGRSHQMNYPIVCIHY